MIVGPCSHLSHRECFSENVLQVFELALTFVVLRNIAGAQENTLNIAAHIRHGVEVGFDEIITIGRHR